MEARNIIIAFLMFGIFGLAMTGFLYDLRSNYSANIPLNNTEEATFNLITGSVNQTQDLTMQISQKVQQGGGISLTDTGLILVQGIQAAVQLLFSPITYLIPIISMMTISFGLPWWVLTLCLVSITVVIVFIVINALLRWRI